MRVVFLTLFSVFGNPNETLFPVFDTLQETQTRRQVRARLRAENFYMTNRLTSSPSRVVYGLLPTQTNRTSPSSCGIKHDLEAVQEVNYNNKYS